MSRMNDLALRIEEGDLLTIDGVLEITGLARKTLEAHRRGQFSRSPRFPDPVLTISRSPLFDRSEVEEWNRNRPPMGNPNHHQKETPSS